MSEPRWEVVPSGDDTDDSWGIRIEGEGVGMSVAQMLWQKDAVAIVKLHNDAEATIAHLTADLEEERKAKRNLIEFGKWVDHQNFAAKLEAAEAARDALQRERDEAVQAQKVLARQLDARAGGRDPLTKQLTDERDALLAALRQLREHLQGLADTASLTAEEGAYLECIRGLDTLLGGLTRRDEEQKDHAR